jgi:uncharacterized integral membrane protein
MSVELKCPEIDDMPIVRFARHAGSSPKGDVMPILRYIRSPDSAPAVQAPLPHRDVSPPARTRRPVTPVRLNRAWPATIVLIALIMFTVFAQTTLTMALTVILVVGGIVLTVVFGTTRITRLRRLIRSQDLRR